MRAKLKQLQFDHDVELVNEFAETRRFFRGLLFGFIVSGLLWVAGAACTGSHPGEEPALRVTSDVLGGITKLPDGIMLARCLGNSTEQVKLWLCAVWENWRPRYAGRPAVAPRLWAT